MRLHVEMPTASLNLSTFIALYNYGYRNLYELGPLIDVREAKIPFVRAEGDAGGR